MSNSVILKFTFKMFFEYWYVGLRMFILLYSWFSFVLISFPNLRFFNSLVEHF